MESGNSSIGAGTVLLALVGGAVLGAGVALLYAPQSGRRTRQRLREFSEDAEDGAREFLSKTSDYLEDARSAGEAWFHKGHGCSVEKKQQAAAEAAQAGR
jgi:gas vesicle protein